MSKQMTAAELRELVKKRKNKLEEAENQLAEMEKDEKELMLIGQTLREHFKLKTCEEIMEKINQIEEKKS